MTDGKGYAKKNIEKGLAVMERLVASGGSAFSVGSSPTVADLCVVPQLYVQLIVPLHPDHCPIPLPFCGDSPPLSVCIYHPIPLQVQCRQVWCGPCPLSLANGRAIEMRGSRCFQRSSPGETARLHPLIVFFSGYMVHLKEIWDLLGLGSYLYDGCSIFYSTDIF